ncbi:hypothetical protein M427DRAFT_155963 [Gonapodya prolifera JEL478]|uniref:F-box domain-containing protein n=1 Tax=Gonapodya prolifera (strain JEL478) TaxID=1344416 RepID=A0A139ADB7_GONPJ|nr:hypothetical protein M427DRAFT_155963 [Gonapodya prolifera JEL478]|eukprot:KXS14413.1 hypothetical protein M427DRAFT_155963 [Gonapodya prolifera JEL478]
MAGVKEPLQYHWLSDGGETSLALVANHNAARKPLWHRLVAANCYLLSCDGHVLELQCDNHLLQLPTETIDAILSHLSTDSIVLMSQTCRRMRSIALQNQNHCSEVHIRLEKAYCSPGEFERAVKRTVGAIQYMSLASPTTGLISHVVSITLERDVYLPISVNIIGRILDTFTGLREARFVGCLASGADFITMASADGRSNQWISSNSLRLLDLSEDEKKLREIELGPRGKHHKQDALLGKFFQCHTIQTDEDVHFYVECECPCKQRTQMCPECRKSLCPWCSSRTCRKCGDYASLCTLYRCSACKMRCRSCLKKTSCQICGALYGCIVCTERISMGTCKYCGKRTCTMCVRIRLYHGGDDENWSYVDCFNHSRLDAARTRGRVAGGE